MPDYGTVAGFRDYHTTRGRNIAAYDDDAEIEAAKLVASEWLDARYRGSFSGLKVGMRAQIREWPRTGAIDHYGYAIPSDAVPAEMDAATYEATLRQLVSPGSLSVDWTPPKYKAVSVDGAVSVQYADFYSGADAQTSFVIIDEIIAPILTGRGDLSALSGPATRV